MRHCFPSGSSKVKWHKPSKVVTKWTSLLMSKGSTMGPTRHPQRGYHGDNSTKPRQEEQQCKNHGSQTQHIPGIRARPGKHPTQKRVPVVWSTRENVTRLRPLPAGKVEGHQTRPSAAARRPPRSTLCPARAVMSKGSTMGPTRHPQRGYYGDNSTKPRQEEQQCNNHGSQTQHIPGIRSMPG